MDCMRQMFELLLFNTNMMDRAHLHSIICIVCHVSYALSVAILAQDSRAGYKLKILALSCAQCLATDLNCGYCLGFISCWK